MLKGLQMLEWTGERYLPWIKDAAIAYEHLHRYVLSSRLAAGKRVLDLASGEGYGSNLLASKAQSVVGVEIDPAAVEHARRKYTSANLQFVAGSITSIPLKDEHSFDVVVCFEAIEHIAEQQKLLTEIQRFLKPEGILLVSTPNKSVYQHESEEENPFHVHELEFEEFRSLLQQFFKNVGFAGQRIHTGSTVWPIAASAHDMTTAPIEQFVMAREETEEGAEFEAITDEQREPLYYISMASDAPLPALRGSVLIDASDQLLKGKDHQIHELLNKVTELLETRTTNEAALAWRETQLDDAFATIGSHETAIAWLQGVVKELEADKAELTRALNESRHELDLVHASRGWQWILRLRKMRGTVRGER
jgi:ubiquinone/menaquinone biosynthesis C-methylase UbiE